MPRVRRVEISRFRGINHLVWVLPSDQQFVALIGPGDGGKTTVLTAVTRALSEAWTVTFFDTDFYGGGLDEPILIRVAVGDLDDDLLSRDVAGLHLCGLTAEGDLAHDPGEGDEACVVVELRVESDLEPRWSFYRPGDTGEPTPMRASVRARFRAFRIDDRIDSHLRWSRTSALGRLTEARHGTHRILLDAHRAARQAVADGVAGGDLAELTSTIQAHITTSGGGDFHALRPGLDTSLPASQGNLALHEDDIPLTSFGLGTRRLVATAIQQLAHPGQSVLLVDELEHGLEPHRIAHLAGQLRTPEAFAQVVVTTHSPVALQHLSARDLATVRRGTDGTVEVRHLGTELQGVLRSSPAAFLARHVLVAEGKTELGIGMYLLERWDDERRSATPALAPAAALGVCAVEGGGSEAPQRARLLNEAGYQVTFFLDGDRDDANTAAGELEGQGVRVVRWPDELNTERMICGALSIAGLRDFITLARTTLSDDAGQPEEAAEQSVAARLRSLLPTAASNPLDPTTWSEHDIDLAAARYIVADAAALSTNKKKGWFKTVDGGRRLGQLLAEHLELVASEAIQNPLRQLHDHLYPTGAAPRATENQQGPSTSDGQ